MTGRRELLDSTLRFRGQFLEVTVDWVRLPNGKESRRETVLHPGAAAVVPVDGGRALLVRQHRHAVGIELLELPAGKLDEPGESPEACARRELEEETGYRCAELELLSRIFTSPGFTDEVIYVFLAPQIEQVGPPPGDDEGEPLSLEWVDLREVVRLILDGSISDAKTIIGLLLALERMGPGGTGP
ncbi:MAG: NUDIX hydrolase [Actinomycetota bacterium]